MSSRSNIEVLVLVGWNVGHAARSTLREIVHRIRVENLRYIMHRRHKLLGMMGREFLAFMQ